MKGITLVIHTSREECGIWCNQCAKPSVIRCDLVTLDEDGVSTIGSFESCTDHED